MESMKYRVYPDGTVVLLATDIKSDIRNRLSKYETPNADKKIEDIEDYDSHKLFK